MTRPIVFTTAEHWRSRLLLLRLRMAPAVEQADLAPSNTTPPPENTTPKDSASPWAQFSELDPDNRIVTLELLQDGALLGEWEMTGRELGLAWDPEALVRLKERFPRLRMALGALAARSAVVLASWIPKVVSKMTAEEWRRDYTPQLSLPLAVAGGLEALLRLRAPNPRVVWLAIDEPAGYIPYLNWERLLAPHVNAPIVRLPARLVDPTSPRNTLDVLMTCSTASTRLIASPTRVVQLIKQILAAVPSTLRCVVHLFADEVYRPVVLDALVRAKLSVKEQGEPDNQRGVIVYPHSSQDEMGNGESNPGQTIEHPWANWVVTSLAGKAVDVVHVIADGDLSPSIASLKVSSLPWGSTEPSTTRSEEKSESALAMRIPFLGSSPGEKAIVVRYVDALQMRDFARQVGAWATVISSAQQSARAAHRVLVHRLAQIATGLFAVHEFNLDSGEKAAGSFYRMLLVDSASTGADNEKAAIPNSPALSFYCHPHRIPNDMVTMTQSLGDLVPAATAAVDRIREVMEEPEATPAWLAVTQRYIENTAADWADPGGETDRDLAAREGVWEALEFALRAIAENSGSTPAPEGQPETKKGANA